MTTPRTPQRSTLSGDVYAQVRADILSGVFKPGDRLRLAHLCTRFGVSLSVVREALTRVAEQGLVRAEPQIGFTVIPLDPEDLENLTEARVAVETWALRRAIEIGDLAWEAKIVSTGYSLRNTPGPETTGGHGITTTWTAAHADFHAALVEGCGNPRILSIRSGLYDASELYRAWAASQGDDAHRDVDAEHQAIMHAVLARDADLACDLLAEHFRLTARILLRSQPPESTAGAVDAAIRDVTRPSGRSKAPRVGEVDSPVSTAASNPRASRRRTP